MDKLLLAAAVAGFTGVAAGAFGAHVLGPRLDAEMLEVFRTAVLYHLIHAVALLAVALLAARAPATATTAAGWLFVAGIVVFSGSLYALALSGVKWLGAITPLGGLCFLGGWLALGLAALRG